MRQDEIIVTCIDMAPGKHQQDHAPYEYFKQVIMGGKDNAFQVAFY